MRHGTAQPSKADISVLWRLFDPSLLVVIQQTPPRLIRTLYVTEHVYTPQVRFLVALQQRHRCIREVDPHV